LSRGNGGIIGPPVIPTTTAAPGIWGPSDVVRNLGGSVPGNSLRWPDVAANPNWSSVAAQCTFKGINAAGGITDSKGTVTGYGPSGPAGQGLGGLMNNAKFRGMNWYSTNNANGPGLVALSASAGTLVLGTGDFTIELWFYMTSVGSQQNLIDMRTADVVENNPILIMKSTSVLSYLHSGASFDITGTTTITTNTYHHAHVTRASGTTYMGLDGAQEGADYTDSTSYVGNALSVGCNAGTGTGHTIVGRLDSWRITKGVAVYSRTYTVPTAPFPDH
jgi:hypothetical protein